MHTQREGRRLWPVVFYSLLWSTQDGIEPLKFNRWLDDSMDMSLSKLREIVKDREAWLQFMGLQRVRHDLVTEQRQLIIYHHGLCFCNLQSAFPSTRIPSLCTSVLQADGLLSAPFCPSPGLQSWVPTRAWHSNSPRNLAPTFPQAASVSSFSSSPSTLPLLSPQSLLWF